jgi:hypothetical protein
VLSRVSMEAGRPLQSGAWTHKMSMSSASTAWWVCGCVWVCGVWGGGGVGGGRRAAAEGVRKGAAWAKLQAMSRDHEQHVLTSVWPMKGGNVQQFWRNTV